MKKLICAVTVLAVSTAHADMIFVDADNCPGPGDGSVRDPYCSIQVAIDNAVDGDEVIVAPGTYFETINFVGKPITLRSSDGPDVTTIDGTGNFHVVQCVSGEGPDTMLDGFTITGGNANGDLFPDYVGGGMHNLNSSPTVANCTISGNSAASGGGMFNYIGSPTVNGCQFSENIAVRGGGLYNLNGSPTVTGCEFSGNMVSGHGGGIWSSEATIVGCMFVDNHAGSSGGGIYNADGHQTITDCCFRRNSAGGAGGGVRNSNGSDPLLARCLFSQNTATAGGAIYSSRVDAVVVGCVFAGNHASAKGGGLYNSASSPTVTNCTFTGNSADDSGGGMWSTLSSQPTVINGVLWGNSPDEIVDVGGAVTTVLYSDVQGGFPSTGNIDADPLFVDPLKPAGTRRQ